MSEGIDSGLFGISIASDSEDGETGAQPNGTTTSTGTAKKSGADRVAQSEEEYQAVKQTYKAKVENGEIWKTIKVPLGPQVSKQETQAVLHAVEELYFSKRYQDGAAFARKLLSGEEEGSGLDEDTRTLLRYYEEKCAQKTA